MLKLLGQTKSAGAVKLSGFTVPHASYRKQAEKCAVGLGSQSQWRRKEFSGIDQSRDLVIAVLSAVLW
jgi:hypothetical protein